MTTLLNDNAVHFNAGDQKERVNSECYIPADCIITAAGLSSRMGRWKMMLPYSDGTILDASIKNALSSCQRVILVTGYRGNELAERYSGNDRIFLVHNPDYPAGLFSSIQRGILHINSDFFFSTHGDMPCISPSLYRRLWQCRGEFTLFPTYQGKAGHPVLMPKSTIRLIQSSPKNSQMKTLLRRGKCCYLNVMDDSIHLDVDTEIAYQNLLGK